MSADSWVAVAFGVVVLGVLVGAVLVVRGRVPLSLEEPYPDAAPAVRDTATPRAVLPPAVGTGIEWPQRPGEPGSTDPQEAPAQGQGDRGEASDPSDTTDRDDIHGGHEAQDR